MFNKYSAVFLLGVVFACLYPSDAVYDLVKGGDQPYPGTPGKDPICTVDNDPVCKDTAIAANIGGGFEVEDAVCQNNTVPPIPGLPTKFCVIIGFKLDDKKVETSYQCSLYTSTKDNKTPTIHCEIDKDELPPSQTTPKKA